MLKELGPSGSRHRNRGRCVCARYVHADCVKYRIGWSEVRHVVAIPAIPLPVLLRPVSHQLSGTALFRVSSGASWCRR